VFDNGPRSSGRAAGPAVEPAVPFRARRRRLTPLGRAGASPPPGATLLPGDQDMTVSSRWGTLAAAVISLSLAGGLRADDAEEKAVGAVKAAGGVAKGRPKLGDRPVKDVVLPARIKDDITPHLADLKELRSLTAISSRLTGKGLGGLRKLETLTIPGAPLGDEGAAEIGKMTSLKSLDLAGTNVTDAGVDHLRDLKDLVDLSLARTAVTDKSAKVIGGFDKLEELWLNHVGITDAGLRELQGLSKLQRIYLTGAKKVTPAGLDELKKAIPGLTIKKLD
jgi:hypothetical protein